MLALKLVEEPLLILLSVEQTIIIRALMAVTLMVVTAEMPMVVTLASKLVADHKIQ